MSVRVIWNRSDVRKKGLIESLIHMSVKRDVLDIRSSITVMVSELDEGDTENLAITRWTDHWVSPREFEILLSDMLFQDTSLIPSTILHEMVHVRQMARGQYRDRFDRDGTHRAIWMSERVDLESMEYEERPWEIEAMRFEEMLVT